MTKQLKEAEEILKSYQKRFSIPTDDIEEYFDKWHPEPVDELLEKLSDFMLSKEHDGKLSEAFKKAESLGVFSFRAKQALNEAVEWTESMIDGPNFTVFNNKLKELLAKYSETPGET